MQTFYANILLLSLFVFGLNKNCVYCSMKPHTKIYFDYFGYTVADFVACEVCGNKAVDIHHINARGMGGDPTKSKDVIENLQAVCRECHIKYGDKTEFKQHLKDTHLNFMQIYGKKK